MKLFTAVAATLTLACAPAFAEGGCVEKTSSAASTAAPAAGFQTIGTHARPVAARQDIVDVAASNPSFSTLVAAVQAAGLVDTLKGSGPFTVFAPTNEAFAKLPPGTVQTLLRPENRAQLVQILTYHVVPGRVTAAQLAGRETNANTVEGRAVRIDGRQGVSVNNARVVTADVSASNGVIHVIDTVLLPPTPAAGSHHRHR